VKTEVGRNPLDKLPSILRQNLDKNLCTCNEVPKMDIINAIVNGAITVEEVKKQTYATMGTGCCIQQVERLIECLCAPEPKRRRKNKRGSRK
jgi:NAD(P)H-nitrite reductase large subunit